MLFKDSYAFLSNMYPVTLHINGLTFTCSEAAFQSFKLIDKSQRHIFENISGFEAKRLGKKVTLREDWNDIKLDVMEAVLRVKFSIPELRYKLISIDEDIIEHNTWNDIYWGVSLSSNYGENHLGQILMKLKEEDINE